MSSDPAELGKGLFGYRKSAVNQIIADRDIMLRQAEGRVRAAESKVAELESELVSMRERNGRMDEQLERLRQQLDALVGRGVSEAAAESAAQPAAHAEPAPMAASVDEAPGTPPEPQADEWAQQPVDQDQSYADQDQPYAEPWDQQPATDEAAFPSFGLDEAPQAMEGTEDHWAGSEHDWPALDETGPETGTDSAAHATGAEPEEDLPYGPEISLRHDELAERPAAAWMHTGPAGADEAEQDEVAMAAGGYGFEDYDAGDQDTFGEFGTGEEEGESPSPFSRFPFSSDHFDQEPADVAEHVGDEVAEPAPPGFEAAPDTSPSQPAWEPPSPEPVPQAAPPAPAVSQETADITNRFLTEELAGILAAAEESAARIVERARATTQRQIARSNRVWRDVQAEVSRFASWRQDVEPLIRGVKAKVESVRSEIEEVPERIRQALAPMADAISSIDSDLNELAGASNPPLLLAPGGLESEESDLDGWDFDEDGDDLGSAGDHTDAPDSGSGHLHAG